MGRPDFAETTSSFQQALDNLGTIVMGVKDDAANPLFKSFFENILQTQDKTHASTFPAFVVESAIETISEQEQSSECEFITYALFLSSETTFTAAMSKVVAKLRKEWAKPTILDITVKNSRFFVPISIQRSVGLPARIYPNIEGRDPFWSVQITLNIKLEGY